MLQRATVKAADWQRAETLVCIEYTSFSAIAHSKVLSHAR
jgi:hypothetical protein